MCVSLTQMWRHFNSFWAILLPPSRTYILLIRFSCLLLLLRVFCCVQSNHNFSRYSKVLICCCFWFLPHMPHVSYNIQPLRYAATPTYHCARLLPAIILCLHMRPLRSPILTIPFMWPRFAFVIVISIWFIIFSLNSTQHNIFVYSIQLRRSFAVFIARIFNMILQVWKMSKFTVIYSRNFAPLMLLLFICWMTSYILFAFNLLRKYLLHMVASYASKKEFCFDYG